MLASSHGSRRGCSSGLDSPSSSTTRRLLSSSESTVALHPPLPLPQAQQPQPPQTQLWCPGSTSYPSYTGKVVDPSQSELQLHKFYKELSESSYDLSLRDIVDSPYSISGKLKPAEESGDTNADCRSGSKGPSSSSASSLPTKSKIRFRRPSDNPNNRLVVSCAPRCRLSFSFSFRGMRNNWSHSWNLSASRSGCCLKQDEQQKAFVAGSPRTEGTHILNSKQYPYVKREHELIQGSLSAFKVHPSNQCYSCSSYTIFFKLKCLVCGKLYCSNCAKDALDVVSRGHRCKKACSTGHLGRRFASKRVKNCWPFGVNTDGHELQFKH